MSLPIDVYKRQIYDILTFANSYDAPEQVEAVFKWDVADIFYNYFFVGNYIDVGLSLIHIYAFWEKQGFSVREDLNYRNKALANLVRIFFLISIPSYWEKNLGRGNGKRGRCNRRLSIISPHASPLAFSFRR